MDESASPEKRQEATNKTAWAIAESKKSLEEGRHNNPYVYFPQVYAGRVIQLLEAKRVQQETDRRVFEEIRRLCRTNSKTQGKTDKNWKTFRRLEASFS